MLNTSLAKSLMNNAQLDDLKKRLLFLLGALLVFVLTVQLTVPGIDLAKWQALLKRGPVFSFLGMFTGGALSKFSIVAMGITPYINASIMMQLLVEVFPNLKQLQREEGEEGRRKLGFITRWLTIVLSFLQASMMTITLVKLKALSSPDPFHILTVVITLVAGTVFLMWLGEQITDKGIGNGVSILIFAGILLRYPYYLHNTLLLTKAKGSAFAFNLALFFIISIGLIVGIIVLTLAYRRIPVHYARRVSGRKVYGGQSSYIPIRLNNAGVISIIFAISLIYFPITIYRFLPLSLQHNPTIASFMSIFSPTHWFYNLLYALLVIGFTYFYSAITFNVRDMTDNLKKMGAFIAGIRPGKSTKEHLNNIFYRLTFVSALSLAFIAVAPNYVMMLTGVRSFYLGSTSLLIIVGVVLDLMQQIQARLVMKSYKGFMK